MIEQGEELSMSTDAALISALTPKRANEFELKPYSLMRQVIALDLCRQNSSVFFNAIMTMWVCTLETRDALAAHEDIPSAQLRAFEWAEAQGYSLTNYKPVLEFYNQLNRELGASMQVQVRSGSNGESPKNVGGPAVP